MLHIADVEGPLAARNRRRPDPRLRKNYPACCRKKRSSIRLSWPVPPAQPLSWYFAKQDEVRAKTRLAVAKLYNPELTRKRGDNEFSVRWLLYHVLTHEAYHAGQAVLLSILHERR